MAFGERLLCLLAVTESGRPASASLCIQDGETLHYVYGQNVHEQRHTAANSLIVWRQIELACERGLARVDLGRGEVDSSNKRFKDSWGVISPLCETVVPVWRRKPPDLTPTNPGFQAVQKTWSRLPLAVTRRVGPLLMMGIG